VTAGGGDLVHGARTTTGRHGLDRREAERGEALGLVVQFPLWAAYNRGSVYDEVPNDEFGCPDELSPPSSTSPICCHCGWRRSASTGVSRPRTTIYRLICKLRSSQPTG
jgi:hypothetical protein